MVDLENRDLAAMQDVMQIRKAESPRVLCPVDFLSEGGIIFQTISSSKKARESRHEGVISLLKHFIVHQLFRV